MQVALFQPDQAGNVGAVMRVCACMATELHIIQPCGFAMGDKQLRRSAMDYAGLADVTSHADWDAFRAATAGTGRLILLSSKGKASLYDAAFMPGDIILMGSESSGVPDHVAEAADLVLRIPMRPAVRSLNLSVATGIALCEGLRQTGGLPAIS